MKATSITFPVTITLSVGEVAVATFVGTQRDIAARVKGRRDTYGYTEDRSPRFELAVQSAAAEQAVAKALDRYWTGALSWDNELPVSDVSQTIEVRWTKTNPPRLITHKRDHDDRPYFLVTGSIPTFTVHGWAMGRDTKVERYWNPDAPHPAFFVPVEDLLRAA